MITILKDTLWSQFGASIDMLQNAINKVPDEAWHTNKKFFFMSYHTLIFLDYYLNFPAKDMSPALPFTTAPDEMGMIDDLAPAKHYSKKEILDFLQECREKCRKVIGEIDERNFNEPWVETTRDRTFPKIELLLYNMRHVQHHAAQLNMLLRQTIDDAPKWVSRVK